LVAADGRDKNPAVNLKLKHFLNYFDYRKACEDNEHRGDPMAIATISRIEMLRRKLDLTQKAMARILGVTERTVVDLEGGRELSEGISRRMTELERLERGLRKVVWPEAIGRWLMHANDAFDGDSPADVIAKGKVDLLWQIIHELRSGSPS